MSWLSKALGGNTLKVGAAILGSTVAKEYLFGETTYSPFGDPEYKDTGLISKGFNKLGITPFGATAAGSFLSPALEAGKELFDFSTDLGGGKSKSFTFDEMPTVPGVRSQPLRTNTSFQAGRMPQIPVGNNGAVNRALSNPNIQSYLAKRARMVNMPTIQTASPNVSAKGTSLASTTSAKRRARSRLIS